jgi:hypothetical protein
MTGPGGGGALDEQTRLYGEPLAEIFRRVMAGFGIPQSRLAEVIGLSAPMLSQLASGRRTKISNPAVYGRLLQLDDLARRPDIHGGDTAAREAGLAEVASARPSLTTRTAGGVDLDALTAGLAALAAPGVLRDLATACPDPRLAEVLRQAAAKGDGPG